MSPFNNVSFKQFKESAATYFEATLDESCSAESAHCGFKALTLLYFGHSDNWTADEVNESVVLIERAAQRIVEIETKTI